MPLHYAVLLRMPEMVRALMQAGADPHVTTAGIYALRDAATPLAIALERGYEEIVAIIREEEQRREAGRPAVNDTAVQLRRALETDDEDLGIALLKQYPEMVQLQFPGRRWTLLHLASALLLPRIAGWLLDAGADVNAHANDGSAPLDVAGLHRRPVGRAEARAEMARLLRGRGAELTARSAVILGDEALLRKRAAEEDLVTPRDDRGWLLRLAVDCDRPEIVKLLLDLGLDPDARVRVDEDDSLAFTWGMPLYECARYGKHALAEMLLERGADPNGQVYASGTPLSEAYGQRDERMVALLERYGGKSNASMAGLYRRHLLDQGQLGDAASELGCSVSAQENR